MFLFIVSCTKEEANTILSCENSLYNWKIETISLRNGIQKQNDVYFASEKVGFSVGNAGSIMKTDNGGENWEILEFNYLPETGFNPNSLTSANLETAFFIDDLIGYIGGEGVKLSIDSTENKDAVFLITNNGGSSWNKTYLKGVEKVHDLKFSNISSGVGLFSLKGSNEIKLFMTEDAGINWNEIELPVYKIATRKFIDSEDAIIVIGEDENFISKILISLDDGRTWEVKSVNQEICNNFYFINDKVGFASCKSSHLPTNNFKTIDGGDSWQRTESPYNVFSIIHFSSIDEGFIINPKIEYEGGAGNLYPIIRSYEYNQTNDGGNNWDKIEINENCNLIGVTHSPSKEHFFSIGITANKFMLE